MSAGLLPSDTLRPANDVDVEGVFAFVFGPINFLLYNFLFFFWVPPFRVSPYGKGK